MQAQRSSSSRAKSAFRVATYFVLALGGLWLGYQFWRLCFQPLPKGAVDLMLRYQEVDRWFDGKHIYRDMSNAVYPPASYLILAPLDWVSLETARYAWALLSVGVLAALARGFERRCVAGLPMDDSKWRSRFLFVLPLGLYPFGASVGNGQVSMLVVACLFASFALQEQGESAWKRDAVLACMFILALLKPTIAAFFFWIVLLAPGGMRRGALVVGGYAALTYMSSTYQKLGPIQIMRAWSRRAIGGAEYGATQGEGSIRRPGKLAGKSAEAVPDIGNLDVDSTAALPTSEPPIEITHINLHSLASVLGQKDWILVGSLVVLFGLGIWVWMHRRCSVWLLAGVTAIVARFAIYHGWYDDVMLLFSLVALFRISQGDPNARGRFVAGSAFALMSVSLLAPGGVYLLPHPWNNIYVIVQACMWISVLAFLLKRTWKERASS